MLYTLIRLFDNLQIFTTNGQQQLSFTESLVSQLLEVSFDEHGEMLKQVLEEHYRDGIDGFEDIKISDDTITGIFLDRINQTFVG
jgi:hypothetical protein